MRAGGLKHTCLSVAAALQQPLHSQVYLLQGLLVRSAGGPRLAQQALQAVQAAARVQQRRLLRRALRAKQSRLSWHVQPLRPPLRTAPALSCRASLLLLVRQQVWGLLFRRGSLQPRQWGSWSPAVLRLCRQLQALALVSASSPQLKCCCMFSCSLF